MRPVAAAARARAGDCRWSPVARLGWCGELGLDAVEGVAALGEVGEGQGAQLAEGALDAAGVTEPERDVVDVCLGGDDVGGV